MVNNIYEARTFILMLIRDLMLDTANDGSEEIDLDSYRDYLGKMAELILDEIGLDITGFDGNVATATISPPDGWA